MSWRGLIVVSLAMLASCTEYETIGDAFILSRTDYHRSFELAEQGDTGAAFRLYEHLSAGGNDYQGSSKSALEWLEQAAVGGLPVAQQNLITTYLVDRNPESCQIALDYVEQFQLEAMIEDGEVQISQIDIEGCERLLDR